MGDHAPGKLASILSKAKRHGLRRLPTSSDLRQIDEKHRELSQAPPPPLPDPVSRQPLYLLTTGEEEADRIQLKNDLCKLAFEGEFSSPIEFNKIDDGRVLDIGCGPGSWCIDLAQQYPRLHVIGVDNIDMFPDPYTIPPNCKLINHNVLEGLCNIQFEPESFDCIHIRFMCLAFSQEQYTQVINNCWQLLKPGGYLEMMEMDMMVYSPGPTTEMLNLQGNIY
ncbi:S-adenosyl-L-methionine-dependent methyltransferase [Fennellomyces sp. T-0311]|nr:S-adenosyl-L-methionine-dependent methyltransferase [Fennellomyces sp. T-0311]